MTDNILRDLFHNCALVAWMEIAEETGQWPPDSELTRVRAYQLYERELAREKSAHEKSAIGKPREEPLPENTPERASR